MVVTNGCAYLRMGGEQFCLYISDFDVCFSVVVGVDLVSIIDEIVRVLPRSAEQTCEQDKMSHFLRGSLFQTKSSCCDWQPFDLDFPALDSCSKSLRASALL